MEVVFKVSLVILGNYKDHLLKCDSFESTMHFLKVALPSIDVLQMQIIFNQVFDLDISRQLHAYEVEYHVLLEEMVHSPKTDNEELENLRNANKKLKAQNMELMEQLQNVNRTNLIAGQGEIISINNAFRYPKSENQMGQNNGDRVGLQRESGFYSKIHNLESSNASLKSTIQRLEERISFVEDEKEGLLHTMCFMKKRLEKLEVARFEEKSSENEDEEHPPPFGVVYAMAGSEKEEDEQFKAFIRQYCQEKVTKGVKEPKMSDGIRIEEDIAEESTVVNNAADFTDL
ncbi:TBC1 domain family member 4 [Caerostris extrusa]|uniref:TBC1 domain family member 4 n=1 Tax=Caerostris extrusa TaxID=172846 RepID=A0AAV4WY97_CAEEX|nr:TBC1 domain family member 4 [Caerostris extrusa]